MEVINNTMYLGGLPVNELMQEFGSPLYIYEEDVIRAHFRKLRDSFSGVSLKIHYAMKANYNPSLLKILLEEGACIDAVSPLEVKMARKVGFAAENILFTGNNVPLDEIKFCIENEIPVNIESLSLLRQFGEAYPSSEVSIRVNPGIGSGHHAHCITGGPKSKFGIYYDQLDQVHEIIEQFKLKLTGIHSHIGTGILETSPMLEAMEMVISIALQFPKIEFIDIGGGFGLPYHPDHTPIDFDELGSQISQRFQTFCREEFKAPLELKMEPGRFLVGSSGTLLATVNNIKHTPQYRFIGVDTGFNHLLRPAMYNAYHRIYNASRMEGNTKEYILAGNICETGDVFNHGEAELRGRDLPEPQLGDRMAIMDAGAYGMSMASQYNMRSRPAEVLVCKGNARLIRKRETFEDLVQHFID